MIAEEVLISMVFSKLATELRLARPTNAVYHKAFLLCGYFLGSLIMPVRDVGQQPVLQLLGLICPAGIELIDRSGCVKMLVRD